MTPDRWQRVKSLFERAVDLPPAARDGLLDTAGESPSVVVEVRELISSDALAGSVLQNAASAELSAELLSPSDLVSGHFRIVSLLGQGGVGEVWLAYQTQPVRRRVAIKLIKAGMDTRERVARFESERQALMEHPNIAKVFEAGATPQGRPYFVMEYVTGVPITEYCDKHRMTLRERLELFVHVCEGVQHAHQKAIIHRDLKPTNILVGEVDGKPVPRIIDFGLAKATSQRVTAETLFTPPRSSNWSSPVRAEDGEHRRRRTHRRGILRVSQLHKVSSRSGSVRRAWLLLVRSARLEHLRYPIGRSRPPEHF